MTDLSNPHDRFFKELFSRKEAAQEFLRLYLPPEVAALLDPATLELTKDSFIDPELQEHFSDMLYKINLSQQQPAYIYLLFEHKSYPDRLVAWQLLRYMVRIWEQDLKQQQRLRPIVPLVLYHGLSRWTVARHLTALFEPLPAALQRYVPSYEYVLYDLSQYPDEAIQGAVILRVGLLLLKYILRDELPARLGEILGLLEALLRQPTGLAYVETILRYVTRGTDKISLVELQQVVSEVFKEGAELMPTIAEQLIEQGRAEGLVKGREEGLTEGLVKGREEGWEEGREAALRLLRRLLAHRFGIEPDRFDAELAGLDLAALSRLTELAFEAKDLTEFEAELALETGQANGGKGS